jgi:hypothetical protein
MHISRYLYDPNLSPGIRVSTDANPNCRAQCHRVRCATTCNLHTYKYKPNVKKHRIWQQNNLAKFQDLQSKWLVGHEIHSYHADQASTVEKTKVSSHMNYAIHLLESKRLMQLLMGKSVEPAPRHGIRKPAQHF